MIHYHWLPITPETAAVAAISGGHAFVSVRDARNLALVIDVCQSFAVAQGAVCYAYMRFFGRAYRAAYRDGGM